MNPTLPRLAAWIAAGLVSGAAWGQAASAPAAPPAEPAARSAEPNVQHIVQEDEQVRIEELRVRGETKRIVVRSKIAPMGNYEVLPADGGRDMTFGPQSAGNRGSAGQRVWNVLNF